MTLQEIKDAVNSGKKVYYGNKGYEVIKDGVGQWLIVCTWNNYCCGLTWQDGVTMNGKETGFFVEEN